MRKILLTLVALLALAGFSARAEKPARAASFCNEVKKYLTQEGYAPTIDSDGDVKFKCEGDIYYVYADTYDDGYYVKVMALMNAADASRRGVLEAVNETMRSYRYVRCYLNNSQDVVYECAGYFDNLYQFKQMFPNYMSVLKSADKKLKEVYSEYDN